MTQGAIGAQTQQEPSQRSARLHQLRDRFIAVDMRTRALRLTRCTRSGALDLTSLEQVDSKAFGRLLAGIGRETSSAIPLLDLEPVAAASASVADDLGALARAARGPRFWARSGWDIVRVTPEMWRSRSGWVLARIRSAVLGA